MKIQKRGMLTDRIKAKSLELLGYEICVRELRLIPYIWYVLANEQVIKREHINDEERKFLLKWIEAGHIESLLQPLKVTKEFWNILSEIMYLGYVDTNK